MSQLLHVLMFWEGKTHLARMNGHTVEPLVFGIYDSKESAEKWKAAQEKSEPQYDYKIVSQYKTEGKYA